MWNLIVHSTFVFQINSRNASVMINAGERSISILFYLDENKVHTHSWNKITVNSNVYVLWSDLSKINSCNKVANTFDEISPQNKTKH